MLSELKKINFTVGTLIHKMSEISVFSRKGIEVYLDISRDKMELGARGPLSSFAKPALKKINPLLRNEKPVEVGEEKVVVSTWLPPIPSRPFERAVKNEVNTYLLGRNYPQAVSLNISECSLYCDECNILGDGSQLETELVERFIGQAQDLGAISIGFAEGDPLLRDDIFDLIRQVDQERSIVNVFTPGPHMNKDNASKLKEAGVHAVITGIKSPVPEEHDEARGLEGAFDAACSGMVNAVEAGLYVSMHVHVKPGLVETDKVREIYSLAEELGVHELTLWDTHPTWGYKDNTEIMLEPRHREKLLDLRKKANNSNEGPRVFYNGYFESEDFFGCMAGKRWLNLIHNGDVTPCTYVPITFGNIKKDSLKEIWRRMNRFKGLKGKRSCVMQDIDFREKYIDPYEVSELPINYQELK
ncbi:radical SAM/SPASM domain-containing protein [Methanonatronarchaeum sp. AMET6-2]|uniref:radical SAM/SPASM domain-containing protein n=1 Tax=Methanonatronarchaeum sp. AMET6-2 TaxID=2933293 RepID=UPI001FF2AE78|nr:radical SAM protein [Methanonatronarchaeum sp. AMET6-2]UOY09715.1 radical SAM protein [Methanonatronarchaeum sp. AMET6-2]